MRRAARHLPGLWTLLACAGLLAGCGGDKEDEIDLPPPIITAPACTTLRAPSPGDVTGSCGAVSGSTVAVELLVTDTPPGEAVVSAVFEIAFDPSLLSFDSCSAGTALGAPAELAILCDTSATPFSGLLLASISRQGPGPGVAVSGTANLMTLRFRLRNLGVGSLTFQGINDPNGSALLRRNPGDPTQLQLVPGITFGGAGGGQASAGVEITGS